ncbi:hypothetical protein [Halobacillus andaensis]|uniref:hypothetical protein n=1 Tax=Halobacillus andaensis TaxID=1176239 RepID=UPI003D71BFF5
MLGIIRFIFFLLTLLIAGYGLLTGDFRLMPFMMLSLGGLMLVSGLYEWNRSRAVGYMFFIVSTFVFYAFGQSIWLH